MEIIDQEKAARVWQRVQARTGEGLDAGGLKGLIAREWEGAAVYLGLSRRIQGQEGAILRKLFEQEQSHAACLKGIYTLITGQHLPVQTPSPRQEPVEATLRRCYGNQMRSLAEYEARAADPEYGRVFERLALQERENCRLLLEVIGRLKKK